MQCSQIFLLGSCYHLLVSFLYQHYNHQYDRTVIGYEPVRLLIEVAIPYIAFITYLIEPSSDMNLNMEALKDREPLLPVADAVAFAQKDPDRKSGSDPGESSGSKTSDSGNSWSKVSIVIFSDLSGHKNSLRTYLISYIICRVLKVINSRALGHNLVKLLTYFYCVLAEGYESS